MPIPTEFRPRLVEQHIMHIVLGIGQAGLRLSLEFLLSEEPGVTIVGEASESEGMLALINSSKPDLVIFDQDLPGQPFDELLHHVQRQKHHPYLMVLGTDRSDEKAILAAGVDALVIKGEPPETLLAAYRRIRRLSRSARRSGSTRPRSE